MTALLWTIFTRALLSFGENNSLKIRGIMMAYIKRKLIAKLSCTEALCCVRATVPREANI